MNRPFARLWIPTLALALAPSLARAQQDTINLVDGSVTFSLENLRAPRTGNTNGRCTFTTGSPATNHMFQNWFWIRAGTDTREYALSNQTFSYEGTNSAILQYDEPFNDGANANAVRVTLQYSLHDLSTATGRTDEALLVIAWRITNRSATTPSIYLFHYADFDAGGTAAGDTALVRGDESQIQVISDPGSSGIVAALPARIEYATSAAAHYGYEMGAFSTVRNKLTDAAISSPAGGSPFGPGDFSAMNQWGSLIFGAAGGNDTLAGSVAIHITTRCKADYNESGALGVNDIFSFLTDWFAGCL